MQSGYLLYLLYSFVSELGNEERVKKITVTPGELTTMYLFFKSRDAHILDN